MKVMKLLSNGLVAIVDLPKREYLYQSMCDAVGDCDLVQIVNSRILGEKYCLVCDEEFLLKGRPVVNPIASYLYGLKEHGQPLCGNVLVMKNEYTPEGTDTVGLEVEDVEYIHSVIVENFDDCIETTMKFLQNQRK